MPSSSIDYQQFLIQLIEELVDHIRYNNGFIFELLKKVTIGKNAIIEMDGIRIQLQATDENGYDMNLGIPDEYISPSFKTTGDDLRDVVNGILTLDKAMSNERIFAKGPLEDLLGVYRLAIGLLIEGPIDPNLRKIWDKFNNDWVSAFDRTCLPSLDEQQVYSYFPFQNISDDVALVKLTL